jgi:drug/metabolite transporter (DMT)-like permease
MAPPPPLKPVDGQDVTMLLILALIWGAAPMLTKVVLAELSVTLVTHLRILIAAVALCLSVAVMRLPFPHQLGPVSWLSCISAVNPVLAFFLMTWGLQHIDASRAALLLGIGPSLGLVLSHLFTRDDKITPSKLAGVVVGFMGLLVLVAPGLVWSDQAGAANLLADVGIIGASTSYVVSGLMLRRAPTGTATGSTAIMLIVGAVLLAPWGLAAFAETSWPSSTAVLTLLALALGPTAIAGVLRFQVVQRAGVAFTSQVSYLIPLFGTGLGIVVLGEQPSLSDYAAMAPILGGIAISRARSIALGSLFPFRDRTSL